MYEVFNKLGLAPGIDYLGKSQEYVWEIRVGMRVGIRVGNSIFQKIRENYFYNF